MAQLYDIHHYQYCIGSRWSADQAVESRAGRAAVESASAQWRISFETFYIRYYDSLIG